MSTLPSSRVPWVDHLRTLVILLVVNIHACVTYSHVGDWYAMSEHEPTLVQKIPFILWETHLQSFFMGVLFFVSGYFAHGSLRKKGPASFARERLFRLGLPTLFYALVVHPFILLALNPWHAKFPPAAEWYRTYLLKGKFLGSTGPMWFAFALLIFCLLLAAWRGGRGSPTDAPPTSETPSFGGTRLLGFGLLLGALSFLTRLVFPIGSNFQNMQLCFFPQYIAAFIVGLSAGRNRWLLPLAASRVARIAGWCAFIGGPLVLLGLMFTGGRDGPELFTGGWRWQAAAYAFWEQLVGLGVSLGLMSLLSRKLPQDSAVLRWLADRCFAVYLLHAPILVALMMLYRGLPQNAYALAALLTVSGLVASFLLADLARRVPGLRAIL